MCPRSIAGCHSIRSGASRLPYYCTPLVCVSEVLELLAVWRHNNPKTKKKTEGGETSVAGRFSLSERELFTSTTTEFIFLAGLFLRDFFFLVWVRLPWIAHDAFPWHYLTITSYRFNKTKQHTHKPRVDTSKIWRRLYSDQISHKDTKRAHKDTKRALALCTRQGSH